MKRKGPKVRRNAEECQWCCKVVTRRMSKIYLDKELIFTMNCCKECGANLGENLRASLLATLEHFREGSYKP